MCIITLCYYTIVQFGMPSQFNFTCIILFLIILFLLTCSICVILLNTYTAQKMKFSIKDFFTFAEEILNGKLHFLCCNMSDIVETIFWKNPTAVIAMLLGFVNCRPKLYFKSSQK